MTEQVKRYGVSGPDWDVDEEPDGEWVRFTDYDALHQQVEGLLPENERLTRQKSARQALSIQLIDEARTLRAELEAARGLLSEALDEGSIDSVMGTDWVRKAESFLTATPAPEVRQQEQRWASFDDWLTWELDQGDGTLAAASDAETRLARRLWFCLQRALLVEQGERQEAVAFMLADAVGGSALEFQESDLHELQLRYGGQIVPLYTTPQSAPEVSALMEAAKQFADAARPNIYPCPDKPNSLSGKLQALDEAIATYRKQAGQ